MLAVLWGWSLWVFDHLPDRIPMHFDAAGIPDRWGAASWGNWLLVPLTALGLAAMMYGIAWGVSHIPPKHINMPRKDRFLVLPPEAQGRVVGVLRAMMYWLTVPMVVIFMVAQFSMYAAARGQGTLLSGAMVWVIVAMLIIEVLITIGFMWWLYRFIEQLSASTPEA